MKPTLFEVIGNQSSQSSQFFNLSKADLTSTGLIASSVNSPTGLLMAILLKSKLTLNAENQIINPDIQITIDLLTQQPIIRRYGNYYRQVSVVVNLRKTRQPIDPDEY